MITFFQLAPASLYLTAATEQGNARGTREPAVLLSVTFCVSMRDAVMSLVSSKGPGHVRMLLPQASLRHLQIVGTKLLAPKRHHVTGNYPVLWEIVVSTPELPACATGNFMTFSVERGTK